jgi:hypothetical protein
MRCLDVLCLFPFVAAAEKNHDPVAMRGAANPVARPVIDSQLEYALPDRLPVAAQAGAKSIDPRQHAFAPIDRAVLLSIHSEDGARLASGTL